MPRRGMGRDARTNCRHNSLNISDLRRRGGSAAITR